MCADFLQLFIHLPVFDQGQAKNYHEPKLKLKHVLHTVTPNIDITSLYMDSKYTIKIIYNYL